MEWINTTLLPEHIVVRSLEEDMFDGLILHHLFRKQRSPHLAPPVFPKQLLLGLWGQVHPPWPFRWLPASVSITAPLRKGPLYDFPECRAAETGMAGQSYGSRWCQLSGLRLLLPCCGPSSTYKVSGSFRSWDISCP